MADDLRRIELREFLRSRRARLDPEVLGLPHIPEGRRVAGLRRAEVAQAAGISVDYYTRLEQGRAHSVSEQVLAALAAALRLDDLESEHLYALAQARSTVTPSEQHKPSAATRQLIDSLDPTPALLHGPFLEVLAINRMGRILFDDFAARPVPERNLARWTFLDPRARTVYPEWDVVAAQMVAILRRAAGTHRGDPRLSALVGELLVQSEDFGRWWQDHSLFQHTYGPKKLRHELVGEFTVTYQSLLVPQAPGQYVVVYHAPPGSSDAEKLSMLSTWDPAPGYSVG